ncbi:MAG: sugar phosphate nucleotidyltransferase [Candidatus Dadabacteria bacterium]|nr:sugar phosphate nucleotidyltransferase [Candidatus Dadabacteria bacterium]
MSNDREQKTGGGSKRRTGGRPERKAGDRPERRSGGRPDRKAGDRPERRGSGRPDRREGDRPERRASGRPDRRSGDRPERGASGRPDRRVGDRPERKTDGEPEQKPRELRTVYLLLAGGAGRRLWPSSRDLRPKPLLRPDFEMSLLESAVSLINSCEHSPEVTVLAGAAQEEAFRSHIDGMDTGGARVRLSCEPVSRNTAPAIALGAMRALDLAGEEDDEDADVVVAALPSDHFVGDNKEFKRALSAAVSAAKKGSIAVIGVQPTRPETGYGYIKRGAAAGAGVFNVGGFTEKPDAETAAGYVEDGFLWNCGIFVFRARVMIDEIKKHAPEVFAAVRGAVSKQDSYGLPDRQRYARSLDISIDYAVMEKTDLGAVVPAGFEWSDVGSWRAVYDILKKGKGGNVVKGDAVVENSEDCLVLAGGGRLVAAGGLKDIAVVDEGDALLVADMNSPESVKALATRLAADKRPEAFLPAQREYKWGAETEIESGEGFSVRGVSVKKKMEYEPGGAGHILVLEGEAVASLASKSVRLSAGDMVEIPDDVSARFKNGGVSVLRLLEVSFKREG